MKFTNLLVILQAVSICWGSITLQQPFQVEVEGCLTSLGNAQSIQTVQCQNENGNQVWITGSMDADGYYPLKVNGQCADVWGGIEGNGISVKMHSCHGGDNQKWIITSDGQIKSKLAGNYCLDDTDLTNVVINECDPHNGHQKFTRGNGNGGITLQQPFQVEVEGCLIGPGNQQSVQTEECENGNGNQVWITGSMDADGYYPLMVNQLCMDVWGGKPGNGISVKMNAGCHGGDNQEWIITDDHQIKSKLGNYCLDDTDTSNVVINTCDPHNEHQQFTKHNGRRRLMNIANRLNKQMEQ